METLHYHSYTSINTKKQEVSKKSGQSSDKEMIAEGVCCYQICVVRNAQESPALWKEFTLAV